MHRCGPAVALKRGVQYGAERTTRAGGDQTWAALRLPGSADKRFSGSQAVKVREAYIGMRSGAGLPSAHSCGNWTAGQAGGTHFRACGSPLVSAAWYIDLKGEAQQRAPRMVLWL